MRHNSYPSRSLLRRFGALAFLGSAALSLAGCEDYPSLATANPRAFAPIPPKTVALMAEKGTTKEAPVLIRAYKKESELEIWKMKADGRYALLKTYPMCRWSGQLGPKAREGDRQVPEGFYSVTPAQMNPNSAYYLSFNVGYPNAYDRALGHDGGSIMVHGICSSAGCFSMTDPQIGEIYAIVREGFAGGQRAVQMQSYPFRMTAENLAKYRLDPNIGFWKQLKEGSDNFEVTQQDVAVGVCGKHYVFNATPADGSHFDPTGACPPLKRNEDVHGAVVAKAQRDEAKVAELAAQGVRPIRTVYADGGQHPDFASIASYASRPDALVRGPVDVALDEGKDKKGRNSPLVQLAALKKTSAATTTQAAATKPEEPAEVAADQTKPQPSLFSRFFGAKPEEPETPDVAAIDSAASQGANVPLPPKRSQLLSGGAKPQASLSAPSAPSAKKPASSSALDKPITGAARTLPNGRFAAVAEAEQR
ncbi:L,D-transpeptidase family protein [Methylocapsa acidiphila]|uniref:L,D-transpeptidase family protein n=1 Tax=Methylocapsa acidiphila TaxID=133552 RepID=UPI0004107A70|nr:L,D-transpeptidase family protein [Methylocapsa acidiphila]